LCQPQEIAKSHCSKLRLVSHLIISKSLTIDTHVFTRAIITLWILEMLRTFSIQPVDPISPTSVRQSVSVDVLISLRSFGIRSFWYPKSYRLAV